MNLAAEGIDQDRRLADALRKLAEVENERDALQARLESELTTLRERVKGLESHRLQLINVLRREGYWAALMTDEEVITQINSDIAAQEKQPCQK